MFRNEAYLKSRTKAKLIELIKRESEDSRKAVLALETQAAGLKEKLAKGEDYEKLQEELDDAKSELANQEEDSSEAHAANEALWAVARHEAHCHSQGDRFLTCTCALRSLEQ